MPLRTNDSRCLNGRLFATGNGRRGRGRSHSIFRAAALAALFVAGAGRGSTAAAAAEAASAPSAPSISFNEHIRPILAKHCVACHGGVKQLSGLSFIYREQALAECDSGMKPIVPGHPEESYLLERVADTDPETRMPPGDHGPALSSEEMAQLTQWIKEGAAWEEHWAYVAPRRQDPPAVQRADWARDPLDRFVLARLEAAGLAPAAEAGRAAWLRRVTLDLIGVPPSPDDYAAFAADDQPDAYERVVVRLLAAPQFGERWAAMWLDLARYADTQGYEKDKHRDAWPYRDWVIGALNDDMPFDQFTIKQLAGDLLPNATLGDRVATEFHRNTQTNDEGGTDDEEFRTAAVLDRVATTWETWQGTTFRCAQCHDHPYEPIRNAEYYKFVALLNTSRDADVSSDAPLLKTPLDRSEWPAAEAIDRRASEIRGALFSRSAALADDAVLWRPLCADVATATGQTKLVVRNADVLGVSEVVAEGTISANGTFTLEFPLPADLHQLTALRIDALPMDVAQALKTPELGFVLTRLQGTIVAAGGAERDVEFTAAFADEPEPLFDPEESLRKNGYGWADYTRQSYPRHAVFAVERPVEAHAGDRLRLVLEFKQTAVGDIPLCIRRGRFSLSHSSRWTDLVGDGEFRDLRSELAKLKKQRDAMVSVETPTMAELPHAFARRTFTFVRGNWLDKDAEVQPGVPKLFPPLPVGEAPDRLAMARWLVAPDNPLTARVFVNRLWQGLFGVGLVETAEDFGTSGTRPSHPELLDHLALRFEQEHAWSIKKMLRDLVLSATYRQSSKASPEAYSADPRNRLLGRGPRTRLSAEMVRDQALALSGRLSGKMFGPPVMPPQPAGVWRSVYNGAEWKTAEGEDRYRRAIYTYWKRTSGYPSMLTFDAPSRDVCVGRRIATNTPLQALATMNDEAYVELAAGLAECMAAAGDEPALQITAGYRWVTGQGIAPAKLERLAELYNEGAAAFDAKPKDAGELAPNREQYALTIVANALLNLDEVLTK